MNDFIERSERKLAEALGINHGNMDFVDSDDDDMDNLGVETSYDVVPNPQAETPDLSDLRGVASVEKLDLENNSDTELEALAELVPDVKARRKPAGGNLTADLRQAPGHAADHEGNDNGAAAVQQAGSGSGRRPSYHSVTEYINNNVSLNVQQSRDIDDSSKAVDAPTGDEDSRGVNFPQIQQDDIPVDSEAYEDYPESDHALEDQDMDPEKVPKEFVNFSSGNSISTATQTHEMKMPMYLPTFKPATGCTNASDFIVRCFVARLRSGITVVKHGRSRWCKSRLRVLHIHPDGRSLSWKAAEGEPSSSKRPPKLDLSTCLEVRHAWSPDPQNPMYTGTPILRQKCESANAHKSFALIFKHRTVDITAVTADQCKVLMEGFSALCFRLQVASLASRGTKKGQARPMPEEDGVSTTASATLTNSSTPRNR
jgi:hypothetical protein